MDDREILSHLNDLSEEEHDLWQREAKGEVSDDDRARRRAIEVELDRCWDLLRQHRARRAAGLGDKGTGLRPTATVEGYEQ